MQYTFTHGAYQAKMHQVKINLVWINYTVHLLSDMLINEEGLYVYTLPQIYEKNRKAKEKNKSFIVWIFHSTICDSCSASVGLWIAHDYYSHERQSIYPA